MDSKKQESIAAICRVGGVGLIAVTVVGETRLGPPNVITTAINWIVGIVGAGALLFGIVLSSIVNAKRKAGPKE